jgi:hypothetical protein
MALLAKTETGISLTRKRCPSFNAIDLNLEKPFPKGEGWVRENKDKEKAYLIRPIQITLAKLR